MYWGGRAPSPVHVPGECMEYAIHWLAIRNRTGGAPLPPVPSPATKNAMRLLKNPNVFPVSKPSIPPWTHKTPGWRWVGAWEWEGCRVGGTRRSGCGQDQYGGRAGGGGAEEDAEEGGRFPLLSWVAGPKAGAQFVGSPAEVGIDFGDWPGLAGMCGREEQPVDAVRAAAGR